MKKKNNALIAIIIFIILIVALVIISNINQPIGKFTKITYKEIQEKTNNKEDFILIVSRSNCSHCITYKPKVKQITRDYMITVYYIDFDEEKEETANKFLEEYNLDGSTPMTLFIKKGKETSVLNRLEGDVDNDKIIERFKKMGFIKS